MVAWSLASMQASLADGVAASMDTVQVCFTDFQFFFSNDGIGREKKVLLAVAGASTLAGFACSAVSSSLFKSGARISTEATSGTKASLLVPQTPPSPAFEVEVQDTGRPAVGVAASSPAVGVATSSPAVSASVEMTPTPVEEDTQTPTKTTPTKGLFSLFSRSPAKDASTPKAAEKGDGSTETPMPSKGAKFAPSPEAGAKPVASNKERYAARELEEMRHFLGAQTLGPAVVSALVAKGLRSTRDVLKLDASKVEALDVEAPLKTKLSSLLSQADTVRIKIREVVREMGDKKTTPPGKLPALCRQLAVISCQAPQNTILAVLEVMRAHVKDGAVQEAGCWTLSDLAVNPLALSGSGQRVLGGRERMGSGIGLDAEGAGPTTEGMGTKEMAAASGPLDNQTVIADKGGVEVIVSAMKAHRAHAGVQEQGCWALSNLPVNNLDNLRSIPRTGGIQAILTAMTELPGEPAVQHAGCWALKNLAHDEGNRELMTGAGAVAAIVAGMNGHRGKAEVQEEGCCALSYLAVRSDSAKDLVAAAGGMAAILAGLVEHPENVAVQWCGLVAVRNLGVHGLIKSAVAEWKSWKGGDGLDTLLAAMRAHRSQMALQAMACSALKSLASNSEGMSKLLVGKGAVELVVAAMQTHLDASRVQEQGSAVLRKLAVLPENKMLIAEKKGIAAVVQAIEHHTANAAVLEQGCKALTELSCPNAANQATIAKKGGIDVILTGMKSHPDKPSVLETCFVALSNLVPASYALAMRCQAVNNDNKQAIESGGGIEAVLDAMKLWPANASLQKQGCWALKNLATNEANKGKIADRGGIDVILAALASHPQDAAVQEQGVWVMRNLAINNENKVKIAAAGGISAVAKAMLAFPASAAVQKQGCSVLRNLAVNNDNKTTITQSGGLEAVLQAMFRHVSHVGVQEQGCLALYNLSLHAENLAKLRECSEGACAVLLRHRYKLAYQPALGYRGSADMEGAAATRVLHGVSARTVVDNAIDRHTDCQKIQDRGRDVLRKLS